MLKELLSIFRTNNPLKSIATRFTRMLDYACKNTMEAGEIFFDRKADAEVRNRIYDQDIEINKLERSIRKRIAVHLSFADNVPDVPYCLLMMSLVKDVERLGDYAKNLSELVDLSSGPLPEDDLTAELQAVRHEVEKSFQAATEVFLASDRERAMQFIQAGRGIAHRCDVLIQKIANSGHDAPTTSALVLGTRYYKRIGGHILNILSSVVMPLHKVDYYDEDVVPTHSRPSS